MVGLHRCGVIVVAVGGRFSDRSVGDEHQVVLGEVDGLRLAVLGEMNRPGKSGRRAGAQLDVVDLGVVDEGDAVVLEVGNERFDERLVLVVAREPQRGQVRQGRDVVDESQRVAPHLEGAGPRLEGEHRRPVEPEVGLEELLAEDFVNPLVLQVLLAGEDQLHEFFGRPTCQCEVLDVVDLLAAVLQRTSRIGGGVDLVDPVHVVENRRVLVLERGHGLEQIPQGLEVGLHLASTTDDEALVLVEDAVHAAAGQSEFLEDGDLVPGQLRVADQKCRPGQRCEPGTDKIRFLPIYVGRLEWTTECLEIAITPVHALYPFRSSG